jgi:hypothetical protein
VFVNAAGELNQTNMIISDLVFEADKDVWFAMHDGLIEAEDFPPPYEDDVFEEEGVFQFPVDSPATGDSVLSLTPPSSPAVWEGTPVSPWEPPTPEFWEPPTPEL